jgi:site-specific recombinase XerD
MKEKKYKISKLVNDTLEYIQDNNIFPKKQKIYAQYFRIILKIAKRFDYTFYNEDFKNKLLENIAKRSYPINKVIELKSAINKLDQFSKEQKITVRKQINTTYDLPKQFVDPLNKFLVYRKKEGLSDGRLSFYKRMVENFIQFLMDNRISSYKKITNDVVLLFITDYTYKRASTLKEACTCLKIFFSYLFNNAYISTNLSLVIPSIKLYNDGIPSVFSNEEVEKLLNSVDRANPIGKRDYCMLLLASRLGLRSSEITNLKFDDILWEQNIINVCQTKTAKINTWPITPEVGHAVIDYLKVRPKSLSNTVFVSHSTPHNAVKSCTLYTIMRKYLNLAGITIPYGKKHGPHSLRFSLATKMLEKQVSIYTIKSILNHNNPDTTRLYIKIDTNDLKNCALEIKPKKKRD